jgi:hypothetical protein
MRIMLGKLPNTKSVRVTVLLPEALKAQLDRYAQLHAQTWEQQVDAAALVPHILAQYLGNDRAFRQSEKGTSPKSGAPKVDASPDTKR